MRRILLRCCILALIVLGVAVLVAWWRWREAPAQKVPRLLHEFEAMDKGRFAINLWPTQAEWDAEWGSLGPEAVPALCEALLDARHFACRYLVARRLGEIRDRRAVGPLITALQDPHLPPNLDGAEYALRVDAALALADIGDRQATEPLIHALQTDSECRVRSYAAVALRRLGDRRAVDALIGALRDQDWLVREEAVDALGDLGDVRAVDPLVDVMARDKLSGVQEKGRRALRQFGVEKIGGH